jgi:hypothetical protein
MLRSQTRITLKNKSVRIMLNRTERKMADDKKIEGVFAGQRRGVVIIDASSHEELGRTLVGLPV